MIESMASLAAIYHALGGYKEAEKIKVEVLELRREVLGVKHPDTPSNARPRHHLGQPTLVC
jgi:hypothetical protein